MRYLLPSLRDQTTFPCFQWMWESRSSFLTAIQYYTLLEWRRKAFPTVSKHEGLFLIRIIPNPTVFLSSLLLTSTWHPCCYSRDTKTELTVKYWLCNIKHTLHTDFYAGIISLFSAVSPSCRWLLLCLKTRVLISQHLF